MPLPWLEKESIDIDLVLAKFDELVEHYISMKNGSMVKFWEHLADKMSRAVARDTPWTWRYPQGVHKRKIKPSREFAKAVDLLLAEVDGLPAVIGRLERVDIYSEPGQVQHGAVVMGASRICSSLGCNKVFVPNVPWRTKCPFCSPRKKKD